MRFFIFGDNPMRDYMVGVDDRYDFVAAKNVISTTFGSGREVEYQTKFPPNTPMLGIIVPGPQGPTFVASLDSQLSPPTTSQWESRPMKDTGRTTGPLS